MKKDILFLANMSALLTAFSLVFLHDPIYRVGTICLLISAAAVGVAAILTEQRRRRIMKRN